MRTFLGFMAVAIVAAGTFFLSGCLPTTCASSVAQMGKVRDVADKAVARFHSQLDAGQFESIYQEADDELKKASKHDDTVQLFAAVHRKLGKVKKANQENYVVNWRTNGTFATIKYETEFADGKGAEQFTWRVDGDKAKLVAYNINSQALIVK